MHYNTDDWSSNNKELVAIIRDAASKAHLQKTFTLDESIDRCLKLSARVRCHIERGSIKRENANGK